MKYPFSTIAVVAVALAGMGLSHAEAPSHANAPLHYTYDEWAYFSGDGFASHPESYGGQSIMTAALPTARDLASMPKAHDYTLPEYLYFTGEGFTSSK